MVSDKESKGIKSLIIYTTGDFPYGMAPENLVRQMALGLVSHKVSLKIIRLRGKWYNFQNETGIEAANLLLTKVPKTEAGKIIELLTFLFLVPISIIKNKFKYKSDAILLYGVEYFYLIFPYWIACKMFGIKLIRITTDYYKESSIVPVWWKRPKLYFYRFQFKHFDKYLDGIVSLSSYMAEYAAQCGVKKERIIIVPHFIDIEGFSKGIPKIPKTTKTRIGFCGSPTEANGILDLIEAFRLVYEMYPESELLIIGEPTHRIKSIILQMTAALRDTVKITGLLSRDAVPAELLTCSILVNPRKSGVSAEAGFPTKLGEYFSCRIPVVATRVGDLKYYFKDKKELVLVNPDHPAEIAEAISYLISNPDKARGIGTKGYEWAKDNLDYQANSAKLLEFINRIS